MNEIHVRREREDDPTSKKSHFGSKERKNPKYFPGGCRPPSVSKKSRAINPRKKNTAKKKLSADMKSS